MLLFCHQPPFLISWFSICKTLSPKHRHISLNIDLQGYQECEERGFQYLGDIARKDAAEECCWSERGRAAHTVIYMAGDVGTCTMESRAFGKEWEGWGKKEDGTKSFLVSSPAPQITHTHTYPTRHSSWLFSSGYTYGFIITSSPVLLLLIPSHLHPWIREHKI